MSMASVLMVARVLAGVLALSAWMPATADIYQWIDKHGTTHFSDRPPRIEDMDDEAGPADTPPADHAAIPDQAPQAPVYDSSVIGENIDGNIREDVEAESPPALTSIDPDEESAQGLCIGDGCLDAGPAVATPLNGQGDIKIGMTKREVIAIWGSPDHARWRDMPEGTLNEWFYEEGPGFTQRIFFRGGKVVRVEIPPVPNRSWR